MGKKIKIYEETLCPACSGHCVIKAAFDLAGPVVTAGEKSNIWGSKVAALKIDITCKTCLGQKKTRTTKLISINEFKQLLAAEI